MILTTADQLDSLDFAKAGGILPVVTQHARTGEVLMLAFATREALEHTLSFGEMWYWSRSRGELWKKGATSGHTQKLVSLHADCDSDSVLARVLPSGPSCHTNAYSCFDAPPVLAALAQLIAERAIEQPVNSYTARLLGDRNLRLKKLGEEATELALACADNDAGRVAQEAADLVYHTLVACSAVGVDADGILAALEARLP
ncbi:MAG: bifunctional phosphoribosyl-AMP cyclohydrolase/phosphoribosyl-ATP diphosphatase HisIE [Anaerolineae bacterium]|nr:bifunctional phosphoribosyl-AMP cyclohydrolase/phosphoribosyl-ATP diphosphatase HisIE [Gemmatimonadaceae bacterium]